MDGYQVKISKIVDEALQEKCGEVPETLSEEIAVFVNLIPEVTACRTDLPKRADTLSHDTTFLVVGNQNGELEVWDVETWKFLRKWKGHSCQIACVDVSRNGKLIASGSSGQLKIWSAQGKCLKLFEIPFLWHGRDRANVCSCSFSKSGTRVVLGSEEANTTTVWDVETGKVVFDLSHSDYVGCCAFSEDDTLIFTGSADHTIKVWDARRGTIITKLKGHTFTVEKCVPSKNGKFLLTCSQDPEKSAKLWDLSTNSVIHNFSHENKPRDGCITSNAALTLDQRKGLHIWDLKTGKKRAQIEFEGCTWCHLTKDEQFLITGGYYTSYAVFNFGNSRKTLKLAFLFNRKSGSKKRITNLFQSAWRGYLLGCKFVNFVDSNL